MFVFVFVFVFVLVLVFVTRRSGGVARRARPRTKPTGVTDAWCRAAGSQEREVASREGVRRIEGLTRKINAVADMRALRSRFLESLEVRRGETRSRREFPPSSRERARRPHTTRLRSPREGGPRTEC